MSHTSQKVHPNTVNGRHQKCVSLSLLMQSHTCRQYRCWQGISDGTAPSRGYRVMLCKSPVMQSGRVQHCHKGQLLRALSLALRLQLARFSVRVGGAGETRPIRPHVNLRNYTGQRRHFTACLQSLSPPTHSDPAGTPSPRPKGRNLDTPGKTNPQTRLIKNAWSFRTRRCSSNPDLHLQALSDAFRSALQFLTKTLKKKL